MELRDGTVTIRTDVAGAAARMGHRLTIAVQDWSASVTLVRNKPTGVVFVASVNSLSVLSGSGGVTPLTAVDKQVIKRNAAKTLATNSYPEAGFESGAIVVAGDQITVDGELTIHGVTVPLTATLALAGDRVTASIPIRQTDFGIKPYSLMLGQLKVVDEVLVDLDIEVPI